MTKIGIVGLGLIGGSIFKDLIKLGYDCIGISNSQAGKIPNVYNNYQQLKACDLIFVCKEMSKTPDTLQKIEEYTETTTVVTDVCSLKEFVSTKEYKYNFIPSHPMAGTEFSGWNNSMEGLFKGAKWVITSEKKSDLLEKVITEMGAEIVRTTPQEHDEAVALISHMPMVVAQALFKTIEKNKLAQKLAASGFRDMTRLALSNIDMASDMVTMNSKNIETSLLKLYSAIGTLTKENYKEQITKIKEERSSMYKDGKNVV